MWEADACTPSLDNVDELTVLGAFLLELHLTVFLREQGVVATDANVYAGMESCATLTNNDIAGNNFLTAVDFDAKAFTL